MSHVIACKRLTDSKPYVKSKLGWCSKCAFPIHIALSTPQFDDAVYMCMTCVPWTEVESIEDLSAAQIADIKEYRNGDSH